MENILIVDDNPDIRQQLKWGLGEEYEILLAGDGSQGLAAFKKHQPGVVILDLGLPPHEDSSVEGFRCLAEMLDHNPNAKIIMLTGNSERENALQAIQMGAYDFYPKPPVLSELKVIIGRALHLANIEEQNRTLQRSLEQKSTVAGGIIGQCAEMQMVYTTIKKVASSDVPVLITGESGTGKELVARAIQEASLRKGGPFIPINCGAIPENLLESEFFGHEKGAFTGAHTTVQGKLQYAHKGTLFLDEIGELPVNLQVKLLRFLQEGTIQRVGGREDIQVDARTICATNVDIAKAINEGKFREDLYYRIGVITIALPPLRERGDDILLLAHYYLRLFNDEHKKRVRRFGAAAINFLKGYEWPGNVRELRNRVQRAVIMSDSSAIEPADLGCNSSVPAQSEPPRDVTSLRDARDRAEREVISAAIERQHGNILKAAEELEVSRPTLYDLLKKHNFIDSGRKGEAGLGEQ
ncbi:PEP-CTERM-box response regulator transcription factor [Geobacter sp. FeAm09]|uniref:PEP-CTERM-box response regulator transcription factor n=1 Tax=Geobacter sp. FeAm09 TaxID=2597769 RepID=UPI0011EBB522|nr:PEP-CTERM-box response regulator transcription factor [Geobacter sp. FeAm09]QEM68650.1 PEP-CTERM-box response regulator transcription factor [Geobacter sp. FeAm09]